MATAKSDGDAGVASGVIAFLIAGVLFMASVVAVLVMTRDQATNPGVDDAPQAAAFTIQADTLADLVFDSTGFLGGDSTDDWVVAVPDESRTGRSLYADDVARLGLLDADEPDLLDYKKFQNLRNAPFEEDVETPVDCDGVLATLETGDCFVNYAEARDALGLDDADLEFHLRAYPSLQSVADILSCGMACKDPNLQVTYVGDILPPDEDVAVSFDDDDWAELFFPDPLDPEVTCEAGPLPQTYRLSTTVRNGGAGVDPVQLRASFTVDFGDGAGPAVTQNVNGYFVPTGGDITFSIDAPAYDGRYCKAGADGTTIEVDIKDHSGVLWTFEDTLSSTTSGVSVADMDFWLETNDYFLSTEDISVAYKGNNIHKEWTVVEIRDCDCSTAAEIAAATVLRTSGAFKMASNGGDVAFAALPAGEYTAVIYDGNSASSTALQVTERVVVIDAADEPLDTFEIPTATTTTVSYDPSGNVEDEVAILESLIEQFCPTYWDMKDATPLFDEATEDLSWEEAQWTSRCGTPTGFTFKGAGTPWAEPPTTSTLDLEYQYGDVFPDSERELRDELVNRLTSDGTKGGNPIYDFVDVLIIGSGVEHSELSSENIKGPIETWVEGGGTLIVLGSEVGKNNNWLNPFLNSGTRSSGGGVSVPDPAHPILHVPDELDYPNYSSNDEVWEFHGSNDANERFTQVVSLGEDGEFEPILAISKPGAIRNDETGTSGTVILTTWVAYDVFRNEQRALEGKPLLPNQFGEGQKFLNNLLMMGYGDLYLDYGPDIPDNTNVVPAVRVGQIRHPDFEDPIEITLITFVFSG